MTESFLLGVEVLHIRGKETAKLSGYGIHFFILLDVFNNTFLILNVDGIQNSVLSLIVSVVHDA